MGYEISGRSGTLSSAEVRWGCYGNPLNEVSAGAKAEVDKAANVAFHGILRLHSLFSAEPLRRREDLGGRVRDQTPRRTKPQDL